MHALLLYDGYCALCNGFVRVILKYDKLEKFRFAALQSPIGNSLKEKYRIDPKEDTVVVIVNGHYYLYHKAAFEVARLIGWPLKTLLVFSFLPNPLLKFFYKCIAAIRYKVFGRYEACPMPPIHKKHLFLHDASDHASY